MVNMVFYKNESIFTIIILYQRRNNNKKINIKWNIWIISAFYKQKMHLTFQNIVDRQDFVYSHINKVIVTIYEVFIYIKEN